MNFQDATETDSKICIPTCAVAPQAAKFNHHHRRVGGVTVTELDHVILVPLQPFAPVGCLVAIFDTLGSGRNLREEFAVQVEMEDGWFGFQSDLGSMITRMAKLAKAIEPAVISATPRDDKKRIPIHLGGITLTKIQMITARVAQMADRISEK